MEVMQPAEVSISTQVQTLALVNREVTPLSKRSVEELSGTLVGFTSVRDCGSRQSASGLSGTNCESGNPAQCQGHQ